MNGKNKAKGFAAFLAAAVSLTGCNDYSDGNMKTAEFFAMDTYISISAYGEDGEN